MRRRHDAADANTPWWWTRCAGGAGTRAASRSISSSGESSSPQVPSSEGRLKRTTSCPSPRFSRRPWATGGRATYQHGRSRSARSRSAMRSISSLLLGAQQADGVFALMHVEVGQRPAVVPG